MSDAATPARKDFVRELVAEDVATGRFGRPVTTRFPPEPNGYLHFGHAKSLSLNFGLAAEFGGRCNLRFDDTNPFTEDIKYVEAIKHDIRWLGFQWDAEYYASDYFERLYEIAEQLVHQGKAYVDSSSEEAIREGRGTVTVPGVASEYRDRTPAENLDLLRRMKAGEFADGAHVLRAKIDLALQCVVSLELGENRILPSRSIGTRQWTKVSDECFRRDFGGLFFGIQLLQ